MGGPVDQSVSPGIAGFLAFFFLAIALWLLMRNMNTRLRNVRYLEKAEAERRASETQDPVVSRPPTRKPKNNISPENRDSPHENAGPVD